MGCLSSCFCLISWCFSFLATISSCDRYCRVSPGVPETRSGGMMLGELRSINCNNAMLNIIPVTCWPLTPVWSLRGDAAESPASRQHSRCQARTPTRSWPSGSWRRVFAHARWVSGSCVSGAAGPGCWSCCAPPPPPPRPACPGLSSHLPGEKVTLNMKIKYGYKI